MARLTASQRRALPQGSYALPGKRYPVNDKAHAEAALRMDHNATPAQRAKIEARVGREYGIGPDAKHKTPEHHLNKHMAHGTRGSG